MVERELGGSKDLGARVKAARTYARMESGELASRVRDEGFRFSKRTLDRVEAGERHLDVREAQVIARITKTPLWFLTRGWWTSGQETPDELEERVEGLAAEVSQIAELQDAVAQHLAVLDDIVEAQLGTNVAAALERAMSSEPSDNRRRAE